MSDKFGESHVLKKLAITRTILLFTLFYTEARYHYSYIEGFRVVFQMKSTVRVFLKRKISKMCTISDRSLLFNQKKSLLKFVR